MNLILCLTETGKGHAVLDYNGYILDVEQDSVMPKQDINYKWIWSSKMDGSPWREIID